MAEEETDEKTEETADAPEADATEVEDAPKEAAQEAAEAPVPDEPDEDAGESPRDSAEEAADVPVPKADAEPAEKLHPKVKRKQERSKHTGESKPERSAEERQAERDAERKRKAASRSRRRKSERGKKGEPREGTPKAEHEPGSKRIMQGIVVSSKAHKTITVQVESARRHPSYEKIVRRSKNLTAHDESNEAGEGDTVRVVETRPMSKTKRWRLVEIMERAR